MLARYKETWIERKANLARKYFETEALFKKFVFKITFIVEKLLKVVFSFSSHNLYKVYRIENNIV